jgi:hypothetical protein
MQMFLRSCSLKTNVSAHKCFHRRAILKLIFVCASISWVLNLKTDIYKSKYPLMTLKLIFIQEKNPVGTVVGSYSYKFSGIRGHVLVMCFGWRIEVLYIQKIYI